MQFDDPDLLRTLEDRDASTLEGAPFGIVGMTESGIVEVYNRYETELSGLSASHVVGKHFSNDVAPCTNNFMVAQRFEDEAALDATIDYVFTLKMRPTPVRLRLMKSPTTRRRYLLVVRR